MLEDGEMSSPRDDASSPWARGLVTVLTRTGASGAPEAGVTEPL